jgi:hypothetical protein
VELECRDVAVSVDGHIIWMWWHERIYHHSVEAAIDLFGNFTEHNLYRTLDRYNDWRVSTLGHTKFSTSPSSRQGRFEPARSRATGHFDLSPWNSSEASESSLGAILGGAGTFGGSSSVVVVVAILKDGLETMNSANQVSRPYKISMAFSPTVYPRILDTRTSQIFGVAG